MHVISIIFGILAVIGMASIACCIIIVWMLSHGEEEPYDDRQRMEDEEQMEYLRKWRETHDKH